MSCFEYNDEIKKDIAGKFSVPESQVEALYKGYHEISLEMKKQYLAHFIRTVEIYARQKLNKKNLIITCEPLTST